VIISYILFPGGGHCVLHPKRPASYGLVVRIMSCDVWRRRTIKTTGSIRSYRPLQT